MSTAVQYIIVGVVLAVCAVYIAYRIKRRHDRNRCKSTEGRSGCGGCDADCPLRF